MTVQLSQAWKTPFVPAFLFSSSPFNTMYHLHHRWYSGSPHSTLALHTLLAGVLELGREHMHLLTKILFQVFQAFPIVLLTSTLCPIFTCYFYWKVPPVLRKHIFQKIFHVPMLFTQQNIWWVIYPILTQMLLTFFMITVPIRQLLLTSVISSNSKSARETWQALALHRSKAWALYIRKL